MVAKYLQEEERLCRTTDVGSAGSGFYPVWEGGGGGGGEASPPNVPASPQKDFENNFLIPPMQPSRGQVHATTKTQKCIFI